MCKYCGATNTNPKLKGGECHNCGSRVGHPGPMYRKEEFAEEYSRRLKIGKHGNIHRKRS